MPNVEPNVIDSDDDESCETTNEPPVVDLNSCNIDQRDSSNGQELDVSLRLSESTSNVVDRNSLDISTKFKRRRSYST